MERLVKAYHVNVNKYERNHNRYTGVFNMVKFSHSRDQRQSWQNRVLIHPRTLRQNPNRNCKQDISFYGIMIRRNRKLNIWQSHETWVSRKSSLTSYAEQATNLTNLSYRYIVRYNILNISTINFIGSTSSSQSVTLAASQKYVTAKLVCGERCVQVGEWTVLRWGCGGVGVKRDGHGRGNTWERATFACLWREKKHEKV